MDTGVTLGDLGRVLLAKLLGSPSSVSPTIEATVLQIRAARVLAVVAVSSALATAGANFQRLFRNPTSRPISSEPRSAP